MKGTYCIFDLEPNKELKIGVLKFSWIICKIDQDNHMFTLATSDYYIKQNDLTFKNYDYKSHGISNKILKLEGENILYVLDLFYESLKTFEVDYVCGFKIKENDLLYIYNLANKHNITNLKKDFFERKFIILDIFEIIGDYTKKNNISCKLDFENLYPYIFKTNFPKTKYHNTTIDCEHSRNLLFTLIMQDITLFDYLEPIINDKIDFQNIDELKNLVDSQLILENNNLKDQITITDKTILKLEIQLQDKNNHLGKILKQITELNIKLSDTKEQQIRLECKNQELENKIKTLQNQLQNSENKFFKLINIE